MNKQIFVSLFFLFLLDACKKEVTFCGAKDPINDLGWLKDKVKDNPPNTFIYKVTYSSTNGFYIVNTTPNVGGASFNSCDNKTIYYSSGGVVGTNTFPQDFELNQQYKEKIYPR